MSTIDVGSTIQGLLKAPSTAFGAANAKQPVETCGSQPTIGSKPTPSPQPCSTAASINSTTLIRISLNQRANQSDPESAPLHKIHGLMQGHDCAAAFPSLAANRFGCCFNDFAQQWWQVTMDWMQTTRASAAHFKGNGAGNSNCLPKAQDSYHHLLRKEIDLLNLEVPVCHTAAIFTSPYANKKMHFNHLVLLNVLIRETSNKANQEKEHLIISHKVCSQQK